MLADSHIIRTYKVDYAQSSDTESETEAEFEADTVDEQQSIATRLEQNQQFMDEQITPPSGENSAWILETQAWNSTEDNVLIRKPTASNQSHRLFNPFIYRNIKSAGTLDVLATLLDTPDDGKVRYNLVVADARMIRMLNGCALVEDAA